MKKTILFLLFSIGMQAQKKDSICFIKQLFNIEIDGHVVKKEMFFKATLEGVEIYDSCKNKYKVRKCSTNNCNIIHLELKNDGILYFPKQNWGITTTPNIIGL